MQAGAALLSSSMEAEIETENGLEPLPQFLPAIPILRPSSGQRSINHETVWQHRHVPRDNFSSSVTAAPSMILLVTHGARLAVVNYGNAAMSEGAAGRVIGVNDEERGGRGEERRGHRIFGLAGRRNCFGRAAPFLISGPADAASPQALQPPAASVLPPPSTCSGGAPSWEEASFGGGFLPLRHEIDSGWLSMGRISDENPAIYHITDWQNPSDVSRAQVLWDVDAPSFLPSAFPVVLHSKAPS